MLDEEEFQRWHRMAVKTRKSAMQDLRGEFYNWACFKAHQCAELAVKALMRGMGRHVYGHSVYKLLEELKKIGFNVSHDLISRAKTLDQYYVPTRYPDAWVEGSPYEYYSEEDASKALDSCTSILNWVEENWKILLMKEKN